MSAVEPSELKPAAQKRTSPMPSMPTVPMGVLKPEVMVGPTYAAAPANVDAFWEEMNRLSATPPPPLVSNPASEFDLVLEGHETWMHRVETVDSASSISSATSAGIEFVVEADEKTAPKKDDFSI
jgi:hypothetical protein